MTGVALVFPGQGTQRVGMGSWLFRTVPEASALNARVSDAAGIDIGALCARGPLDELSRTQHTQPAMFLMGAAAYLYLSRLDLDVTLMAGHSVGEITALWAAGCLTTDDAARLVATRGRLMASAPGHGCMAVIQGVGRNAVDECCRAAASEGRVVVAVHNGPDDWVVSGDREAVLACLSEVAGRRPRKVALVNGSHAFHSPLMAPVFADWADTVAATSLRGPSVPVILNMTGRASTDVDEIRSELVGQLVSPVEWSATMTCVRATDVELVVECGTGRFLTGLARRADMHAVSMEDPRRLRDQLLALSRRPIASEASA